MTATTVSQGQTELPTGLATGSGGGTGMTGGAGGEIEAPHHGQAVAAAARASARFA